MCYHNYLSWTFCSQLKVAIRGSAVFGSSILAVLCRLGGCLMLLFTFDVWLLELLQLDCFNGC